MTSDLSAATTLTFTKVHCDAPSEMVPTPVVCRTDPRLSICCRLVRFKQRTGIHIFISPNVCEDKSLFRESSYRNGDSCSRAEVSQPPFKTFKEDLRRFWKARTEPELHLLDGEDGLLGEGDPLGEDQPPSFIIRPDAWWQLSVIRL